MRHLERFLLSKINERKKVFVESMEYNNLIDNYIAEQMAQDSKYGKGKHTFEGKTI